AADVLRNALARGARRLRSERGAARAAELRLFAVLGSAHRAQLRHSVRLRAPGSNDDTALCEASQFGATRGAMEQCEKARGARRDSTVLYATLKAFHLLAVIVWVGGMAFTLFCLRPAARVLEPPMRVTLMHAGTRRFLLVVGIAIAVIFVCGVAMIALAWSTSARAGLRFNMPLDWYTMIGIFFVMLAVFVHLRSVL